MTDANNNFHYFVSAKGIFMVISMVGQLNDKGQATFLALQGEIRANNQASLVIFNFRDLTEISGEPVALLTQIQREVRSKPGEVRLCGLRPELKASLLHKGIVRTAEIYDNLQTAIQLPVKGGLKKSA